MTTTERTTAVGVFTDRSLAERAIEELRHAGFTDDQIGFIAREDNAVAGDTLTAETKGDTVAGAATGAVSGGIIGGVIGAVASLLIPGFGPAIAGGVLAAMFGGLAIGAVAGGCIGALTSVGVPEEEARYYQQELERGRTIVTINAPGRYQDAVAILRASGAYDASVRAMSPTDASVSAGFVQPVLPGTADPAMPIGEAYPTATGMMMPDMPSATSYEQGATAAQASHDINKEQQKLQSDANVQQRVAPENTAAAEPTKRSVPDDDERPAYNPNIPAGSQ